MQYNQLSIAISLSIRYHFRR